MRKYYITALWLHKFIMAFTEWVLARDIRPASKAYLEVHLYKCNANVYKRKIDLRFWHNIHVILL